MPLHFARHLTGSDRTADGNRRLGYLLAFNAGALNAGGFLVVHQYTSHMTGIVSAMADNVALGLWAAALPGLGALLSFLLGAGSSAILVNHARRRGLRSEYALPLLIEAALLLVFGSAGGRLQGLPGLFVPATVMLLCYIMGLQNALITKMSRAEIRTTHITGTLTDIGIELGRLLYWNHPRHPGPPVQARHARLRMLTTLACSFFVGGVAGALGFQRVGTLAVLPLATLLVALAGVPFADDLRARRAA
jgi:uncharacterized membrane protein YoaK (UPF0700 family)